MSTKVEIEINTDNILKEIEDRINFNIEGNIKESLTSTGCIKRWIEPSDTVPALLSDGSYILSKSQADNLKKINDEVIPDHIVEDKPIKFREFL